MKYILLLLLLGTRTFATEPVQRSSIDVDGVPIYYYLTIPSKSTFPLVILVQGSTCESGLQVFDKLNAAKYVEKVATLIVEKPGVEKDTKECPQLYLKHNSIDYRVKSYLKAIEALKSKLKGWNHEILWIGGSEGGVVASLAAAKTSETKALSILVTGGGMSMAEDILLLTEKQMKQAKAPQAAIDAQLTKTKAKFEEIRKNPTWEKEWMSDNKSARNTYKWWSSILDVKLSDALLSLGKPIYMVHGDSDTSTPVESADQLAQLFKNSKKTNLVYKKYVGMGHDFKNNQGQLQQEVIDSAMEWLIKTKFK